MRETAQNGGEVAFPIGIEELQGRRVFAANFSSVLLIFRDRKLSFHMLARAYSGAIHGIDAYLLTVEADLSNGLPQFTVVGLPDAAVQESRERVRAAVKNTGHTFPTKRVTVNPAARSFELKR